MTHPMPIDEKFTVDCDGIEWIVSRKLIPKDSWHHAMGLDRFYCLCKHHGKFVVSHESSLFRREWTPKIVAQRADKFLRENIL